MVVIQASNIGFNIGMLESTLCDIILRGTLVVYIVEVGVVGKSIEVEFGIFALLD